LPLPDARATWRTRSSARRPRPHAACPSPHPGAERPFRRIPIAGLYVSSPSGPIRPSL
jgi:hypothetical protein